MRFKVPGALVAVLLGLTLVWAAPSASAQTAAPTAYRTYSSTGVPARRRDTTPEQRDAEAASARANLAACEGGSVDACAALGQAYERGLGVEQNRPVAEILYRQACNGAVAKACLDMGLLALAAIDQSGYQDAAMAFQRGCQLGQVDACEQHALSLDIGNGIIANRAAAEALRRETCQRGGVAACRSLARSLLEPDRSQVEHEEAVALWDSQCRALQAETCGDAINYWKIQPEPPHALIDAYLDNACKAGDGWSCIDSGLRIYRGERSPFDPAQALALFDRGCSLAKAYCWAASDIREEKALDGQCRAGNGAACQGLGRIYARSSSPLADPVRALALLGPACEADGGQVCSEAASVVVGQGTRPGQTMDAAGLQAYLERGCTTGVDGACDWLASELLSGRLFVQDRPRAFALYAQRCEAGHMQACDLLAAEAAFDPAAPMPVADERFEPPMDDADNEERLRKDAQRRAEWEAENCNASTVLFRGGQYSDRICPSVQATINGYRMRPGQAPWQALLWRPAVLGGQTLGAADRVLCGGAIIREGWIVTAAHCLVDHGQSVIGRDYRIRLGVYNPRGDEGVSYPIKRIHPHPLFKKSTYAFDIALVEYDARAGRKGAGVNAISRIRLDAQPLEVRPIRNGMPVYTYGWGWTEAVASQSTDHLRGVKMELVDADSCTRITGFRDPDRLHVALCAGGRNGEQACKGDSGGPLITYGDDDRKPTVIGVVSSGVACGTAEKPSRYTRIAKVRAWIDRTIADASR